MEEFFAYLTKSVICLILFLSVYVVFFRRTTFIVFNRVYLLCGLLASLAIPFYYFSYDVVISASPLNLNHVPAGDTPVVAEHGIGWWQIAIYVYVIGIAVLIIRNLIAYSRFIKLIRSGEKHSTDGIRFVNNEQVKSPFTVLNYIVLDNTSLSPTEEKLIIKHEITHVKQKHWIDLICGECMLVLQWFNPLVWLYVSLQKENHEFLADKAVLDGGASPAIYQAVLINRQFGGPVFSFANSFNYSKPLTRLIMMKKTKSSPIRKVALLVLIPVFGMFLWATAKPNYIVQDNKPLVFEGQFALDTIYIGKLEQPSPLVVINGEEYPDIDMSMLDPQYIESISVLKDKTVVEIYGDKGKNGIMVITLKEGYDYSALKKGKRTYNATLKYDNTNKEDSALVIYRSHPDGVVVTTTRREGLDKSQDPYRKIQVIGVGPLKNQKVENFTIDFQTSDRDTSTVKVKTRVFAIGDNENPANIQLTTDIKTGKPLVFKDDKEMPFDEMKTMNPDEIESISVLKDKTAIELYGDKGKNGVILITTKKKK